MRRALTFLSIAWSRDLLGRPSGRKHEVAVVFLPRTGVMGKVIPPLSECIAKNRIGAQPLAERHVARFITQEAPMCTLVHENSQAFAPCDYARSSMPPYARGAKDCLYSAKVFGRVAPCERRAGGPLP